LEEDANIPPKKIVLISLVIVFDLSIMNVKYEGRSESNASYLFSLKLQYVQRAQ
jgi:hypothetical protein